MYFYGNLYFPLRCVGNDRYGFGLSSYERAVELSPFFTDLICFHSLVGIPHVGPTVVDARYFIDACSVTGDFLLWYPEYIVDISLGVEYYGYVMNHQCLAYFILSFSAYFCGPLNVWQYDIIGSIFFCVGFFLFSAALIWLVVYPFSYKAS